MHWLCSLLVAVWQLFTVLNVHTETKDCVPHGGCMGLSSAGWETLQWSQHPAFSLNVARHVFQASRDSLCSLHWAVVSLSVSSHWKAPLKVSIPSTTFHNSAGCPTEESLSSYTLVSRLKCYLYSPAGSLSVMLARHMALLSLCIRPSR